MRDVDSMLFFDMRDNSVRDNNTLHRVLPVALVSVFQSGQPGVVSLS